MDFSNVKIRCSSLGKLLTQPQSKEAKESGDLSETAKGHLIEIYLTEKYGRTKELSNKYIEKGLAMEEDSLTLYSRINGEFFKKNDKHFENDFITGTPDNFNTERVIDLKTSWDIFSFYNVLTKKIDSLYETQLQGYMWLLGLKKASLNYCLVNTPENLICDEKRRLYYNLGSPDECNFSAYEAYISGCVDIEKKSIFDRAQFLKDYPNYDFDCKKWNYDIPFKERMIQFDILFDNDFPEKVINAVHKARLFLNEFEASNKKRFKTN